MPSRLLTHRFVLALAPCLLLPLAASVQAGDCGECCGPKHCCPKNVICVPKIPRMKYVRVCPTKPLCNPCELEGYGYFNTCWHAWPFPPNFSHCVAPPPDAMAGMPLAGVPMASPVIPPSVNPLAQPGTSVLPSMPGSSGEILAQPKY